MSIQTGLRRTHRSQGTFGRRVATCYDFFDAVFPECGLLDLTEGKYDGDPSIDYEDAQRQQAEWLLDQVHCERGSRILDIGCGNGRILAAAKQRGAEAIGITISSPQVKRCRHAGLDARLIDYRAMGQLFPQRFDAVIANGSIEHFVSPNDVLAEQDESIYSDLFRRCLEVLDPQSTSQRVATTVIHRHENSLHLDRTDLEKSPCAFRWGSPQFHYALLQQGFGGWYPSVGQLQRCASPLFELLHEEDGTQDYHFTSEACFQRVRQCMFSWKHGPAVWTNLARQFLRHPRQSATLAICLFLAESWQWQFRGSDPPTRLLRQVWRASRVRLQEASEGMAEYTPPTPDIVQEASEESFPASDAPAWTPVTSV